MDGGPIRTAIFGTAQSVEAAYTISGAIRWSGERIRISVSPTAIERGHLVWTESFDADTSKVFEMQEAIATMHRVLERQPDFDEAYMRDIYLAARSQDIAFIFEGLRRAGPDRLTRNTT